MPKTTPMDIGTMKKKLECTARDAAGRAAGFLGRFRGAAYALSQREYTARDGAILLVLAVILGAALKTAASDTLTIGYDDYRLAPAEKVIDIDALQKERLRRGGSIPVAEAPSGAACSE